MPAEPDELILTQFEEALTLAAHSPATVVNYLSDLRAFGRWGKQEFGRDFLLSTATQEHVRLYRYYLAQELQRASATVNRHLMALRKFFAVARRLGAAAANPTDGVSLVQDDRQAGSRPLTGDEAHKLLQAARQGTRAGLVRRDVAIIQLLLTTGLRVSEIIELQTDDVIFDDPGVRLKVCAGQNHHCTRYVPLPPQAYKALVDYMTVRPPTQAGGHLFLSQDGRSISPRTVQRIVTGCARTAGLEGVSAQSLRRTFAVQLLAETNNVELVAQRFGHQTSSIT